MVGRLLGIYGGSVASFIWNTFEVCSPTEMIQDTERESDHGDQL
jgi:hypothetical protein